MFVPSLSCRGWKRVATISAGKAEEQMEYQIMEEKKKIKTGTDGEVIVGLGDGDDCAAWSLMDLKHSAAFPTHHPARNT